jgi:hypothetical protein
MCPASGITSSTTIAAGCQSSWASYAGLRRFYAASGRHLRARCGHGTAGTDRKLRRDERTSTSINREGQKRIAAATRDAVDCFDRPIVDQLAFVEACGRWPEFLFNGVPFYSLLPDPRRNAWYTFHDPPPMLSQDEDGEGPRTPSMTRARIREDLPELLEGARLLIERRLPYEQALERHFARLVERSGGEGSWIWSFDGIHTRYV